MISESKNKPVSLIPYLVSILGHTMLGLYLVLNYEGPAATLGILFLTIGNISTIMIYLLKKYFSKTRR